MEKRVLKILFTKSGSGSISTKLSVPKSWMDQLGVTAENREVEVTYDEEESSITIKKFSDEN